MCLDITIKAVKDDVTSRMCKDIFPLVTKALKNTHFVDFTFGKKVLSEVADAKGYYTPNDHIVLSIAFDATSCGIPISYCNGKDDCCNCYYNPINKLFDATTYGEPLVITSRYTITTLLDALALLSMANTNSLLRLNDMKNVYFNNNLE